MNVLFNQLVTTSQSDLPEMPKTVVDARDATSQHKSQIQLRLDVSLDQDLSVIALKEPSIQDTAALNAQLVKSETQLTEMVIHASTHHNAQEPIKSNSLLTEPLAVDVKTADGQEKFQINSELLVFQDHLLSAMIALPDNQPMDTAVNNAQLDKFRIQTTPRDATDQPVLNSTQSNLLLITSNVLDARFVDGHNTNQMLEELNASLDQEPNAETAPPDNQTMDTHAFHAQEVPSKIQTSLTNALFQPVMEHMISKLQLITDHAENVLHANGQDKFQTTRELLVSTDHSLNAQTALLEDHQTTTHANNAHSDKFKTQQA